MEPESDLYIVIQIFLYLCFLIYFSNNFVIFNYYHKMNTAHLITAFRNKTSLSFFVFDITSNPSE